MQVVVLPQPNKRKIVPTVGLEPTITDIWAIISSVIQLTDVCRVPAIFVVSVLTTGRRTTDAIMWDPKGSAANKTKGREKKALSQ